MQVTIGAPYGLLMLSDGGSEDLPSYDPDVQAVLSTGRTLLVPVLPEVDGEADLDVSVAESLEVDAGLTVVHQGPLALEGGRLLCHNLRDPERPLVTVPDPHVDCVVAVDDPEYAKRVVVRLVPRGDPRDARVTLPPLPPAAAGAA